MVSVLDAQAQAETSPRRRAHMGLKSPSVN
jgi:hypothetical protein